MALQTAPRFRDHLVAGQSLLGTFIKSPGVHAIEVLGEVGLDFVVIDAEHAPWDRSDIDSAVLAAKSQSLPALVRVQSTVDILTALDCGAAGVMVPPGKSRIEILDAGVIARVFSVRARDLAALAANSQLYAAGAPSVAPLEDWPMPVEGYRIRNYRLSEYSDPKIFGRLFRSRNLMINVFERKTDRRDPRKLTPHSHPDFEQISLTLDGTFIHHLRTPWGADSSLWRDDEHVQVHSPSTLVIPANLIHTTQDIGDGVVWLIDIFGPPRMDFSLQAGVVRNADEYPMPKTK